MPTAKPPSIRATNGFGEVRKESASTVSRSTATIIRVMAAGSDGMPAPASLEEVRDGLASAGYLASEAAALVSFLAYKLGKPVLVEGPAGVGKTELAKALSRFRDRRLVRLQ